jgi:putative ABC transport system permease protein
MTLSGVFGVVSYAVSQRRREIGIRMAIGADHANVAMLMARQSMVPAVAGLLVGVTASLSLGRFLAGFLYEIAPTDGATFFIAITLFACSAFLASYVPARRAARSDPWKILRNP